MITKNILGTPPKLAERTSAAERQRLDGVLMDLLPVSKRRVGLLNDATVVTHLEPANLPRIKVPTLLISTEDDGYGTFRSARYWRRKSLARDLSSIATTDTCGLATKRSFKRNLKVFAASRCGAYRHCYAVLISN